MAAGENLSSKLLSMKFMKNSTSDNSTSKENHKIIPKNNEPHKWRLSTTLPGTDIIPPKRVLNRQGQQQVVVLVDQIESQDDDEIGKMSFGKFQSVKPSKDEEDLSSSEEEEQEGDDRKARKAAANNDRKFLKAAQKMTSLSGGGSNNNNSDKKRKKDQYGKKQQFKKKRKH